jgi:acyl-[acyl-carrier-protein] desaturase
MRPRSEERLYRQYMEFFEKAERKRRWNVFEDIPWDEWKPEYASEEMAISAETFCGVEMYLPDYTSEGLNLVRDSFGQAWFHANWGYEESKHSFSLREYLLRTGQRSYEQMRDYERSIFEKRWSMPFETPREMAIYGALQEKATWMIYHAQLGRAKQIGDPVLAAIYRFAGRDEAAHASFYQDTLALCLEEDRAGTLSDMAHVIANFKMPAYDLIPEYEQRVEVMRSVGIDRNVFFKQVLFPILRRLGVTRREIVVAGRKNRDAELAGKEVDRQEGLVLPDEGGEEGSKPQAEAEPAERDGGATADEDGGSAAQAAVERIRETG